MNCRMKHVSYMPGHERQEPTIGPSTMQRRLYVHILQTQNNDN